MILYLLYLKMNTSNQNNLITPTKPIILFDGVCNLCDSFVQWVIKKDPEGEFMFASLQSDAAKELLAKHQITATDLSTVILIDGDKVYTHSDVALQITKKIGGLWSIFYYFKWLPTSFRNAIYNWIATNRYRFFGKKDQCMIPTPDLKSRFL